MLTGEKEGFDDREDPQLIHVNNNTFFNSSRRHFLEGVDWEDTEFYQEVISRDLSNRYTTPDAIHRRLEKYDEMYESIKRERGV